MMLFKHMKLKALKYLVCNTREITFLKVMKARSAAGDKNGIKRRSKS